MEENQPNNPIDKDPEWENVKSRIPGLADEPKKEEKPPEPAPKETPPPTPPAPEEKKPEEVPPVDSNKADEDEGEGQKKPSRPEKYIPIKQYTDEKKGWKETEAQYQKRIGELENIAGKADSAKTDDKIKGYAEKHGMSFEEAKEQVESLRDILGVQDQKPQEHKPAELSPEQKAAIAHAEEIQAQEHFNTEFTNEAVPELKKLYPTATPEQLAKAKAELEKLACTAPYIDKPLDFVVFKNQTALASLFKPKLGSPEAQHRSADHGPVEYTANDFKEGKTSFSELEKVAPEKLNQIVKDMDSKTYEAYSRHLNSSDKIIINRGGRTIKQS